MEYIFGKQTHQIEWDVLAARLQGYRAVWLDLGTGDGRYVEQLAKKNKHLFLIGIDACRENLRQVSKRVPANALFLIANAETLPSELEGLADHLTLNFPWGSLLKGLFREQSGLIASLARIARENARLEIRLNEGGLRQIGLTLETGRERLVTALERHGFGVGGVHKMDASALRTFPST